MGVRLKNPQDYRDQKDHIEKGKMRATALHQASAAHTERAP